MKPIRTRALLALLLVSVATVAPTAEAAPRRDAIKRNSVGTTQIKDGSLRLRDFRARQVFPYREGQALAGSLTALASTVSSLAAQLGALRQDTYGRAEADATFARRDSTVTGPGTLITASHDPRGAVAPLAPVPGFGDLSATRPESANGTTFTFTNTGSGAVSLSTSAGDAAIVGSGESYSLMVGRSTATLQLLRPGGKPSVATLTVSEAIIGEKGIEDGFRAVAQVLVGS